MSNPVWKTKDLGPVDAYALAVAGGYEGTKEQWIAEIANASMNASNTEAYAKGTRGGEDVESTDPAYHNNAEYFKGLAEAAKTEAQTAAASASAAYGTNLLAPTFSTESTYAVGDHVIYSGGYYECIAAVSTAGSWTGSTNWIQRTVGGEACSLKSALSEETDNLLDIDPFGIWYGSSSHITVVSVGDGTFKISGTATQEGTKWITPPIDLPAGDYAFGFIGSAPDVLQIRDYTGGSDQGSVATATKTKETFTLSAQKTVRLRLHFTSMQTYDNTVYPILTTAANWPSQFIPHVTAKDFAARIQNADMLAMISRIDAMIAIPENTDFDDLTEKGLYRVVSGNISTYTNAPDGMSVNGVLEVIPQIDSTYIVQRVISYGNNKLKVYSRIKSGSPATWGSWYTNINASDYIDNTQLDIDRIEAMKTIEQNTDFDSLTEKGMYRIVSGNISTYSHAPDGMTVNGVLEVIPEIGKTYIVQRVFSYGNNGLKVWSRMRSGSTPTWTSWYSQLNVTDINNRIDELPVNSIPQIRSESFTPESYESQGANVGAKLKVVSYNICNYNNDTSIYISNEKFLNLKKFLRTLNPDFFILQEDREYIDSGDTKKTTKFLFNPVHPYTQGTGGTTIRSKIDAVSGTVLTYIKPGDTGEGTTNHIRALRYAVYQTNNKKILIISTHPSPVSDPDGIAKRTIQYDYLFKWIKGTIQLKQYSGTEMVGVPEWDYCIIGMDANSAYETDHTNLLTDAHAIGFHAANGEEYGWFYTCLRNDPSVSIDNIIVSNNIIMDNVECYTNMYDKLYSDHVPVMAELTLLDRNHVFPE